MNAQALEATESPAATAGMPAPAGTAGRQDRGNRSYRKHELTEEDHVRLVRWHLDKLAGRMAASPTLDCTALSTLAELQQQVDELTGQVATQLAARGFSWAEMGRETGLTRQGAAKKWAQR